MFCLFEFGLSLAGWLFGVFDCVIRLGLLLCGSFGLLLLCCVIWLFIGSVACVRWCGICLLVTLFAVFALLRCVSAWLI